MAIFLMLFLVTISSFLLVVAVAILFLLLVMVLLAILLLSLVVVLWFLAHLPEYIGQPAQRIPQGQQLCLAGLPGNAKS